MINIVYDVPYENDGLVEKYLDLILNELDEKRDFSISFVSPERIRELNREYRNVDSSTDILSFPTIGTTFFPSEEEDLGDIFISIEDMRANAEYFNVSEREELLRLLIHGILHLRGMDHMTNDFEKEDMLIYQERILSKIIDENKIEV